jgi:hypothetical protein
LDLRGGQPIAGLLYVSGISTKDSHDELLRRVTDVSILCEQIEQSIQSLIRSQGEQSDAVNSARALESTLNALKRQLLQYYLECRIGDAARVTQAINN